MPADRFDFLSAEGDRLAGPAGLAAAAAVPETRAVVTIAAPADPAHVTGLFKDQAAQDPKGEIEATIAGRTFRVRRSFLDDVGGQNLSERIATLHKALL